MEAATGHLKSAHEVIDQGGGYHNQLQDMLAACRGIGAIAVKPLQTDWIVGQSYRGGQGTNGHLLDRRVLW